VTEGCGWQRPYPGGRAGGGGQAEGDRPGRAVNGICARRARTWRVPGAGEEAPGAGRHR
jgi:hypothetical protein